MKASTPLSQASAPTALSSQPILLVQRGEGKADKPRMLGLLDKLNARIAELNDGSFVVDDQEAPRIEAL